MSPIDQELVDLYAAETRLSTAVVAKFIEAGEEPPSRDRVDRIGYNAHERRILEPSPVEDWTDEA